MEEFKSINDVLDFAIRSEQEAVDFYTNLSSNASNSEMAEIFKDFAREEMGHKAKLMKIHRFRVHAAVEPVGVY